MDIERVSDSFYRVSVNGRSSEVVMGDELLEIALKFLRAAADYRVGLHFGEVTKGGLK